MHRHSLIAAKASGRERHGIVSSFHPRENRTMPNKTPILLDTFTKAYLHAMAWTEDPHPGSGEYPEPDYQTDFAADVIQDAIRDCTAFQTQCPEVQGNEEHAGKDFWLTRNGHGAGFWDGDWPEPAATILDKASKRFGEYDVECRRGKFRRM
jgi:hypothetical protein